MSSLNKSELIRYNRHISLPEVGLKGQEKLKAAKVLLIGAGGLGSPILLYLAASGIGTIGIVDADTVDLSNLQRQIIFNREDENKSKAEQAAFKVRALSPYTDVRVFNERFTSTNAKVILDDFDLVIDGTDNFATRYLINDACVLFKRPLVYGSIYRFDGQATIFDSQNGPCYRCLFPNPPPPEKAPNCSQAGVLGVLPGQIGIIQATETIKYILGIGNSLVGRLLLYDALKMSFNEIVIPKDPDCPICGSAPKITSLKQEHYSCSIIKDQKMSDMKSMNVTEYNELRKSKAEHVLLDVRNDHELEICSIEGNLHIPMDKIPERINEVDKNSKIIVQCKSGGRSAQVGTYLAANGFEDVTNLEGGILAWIDQIDPSQSKY